MSSRRHSIYGYDPTSIKRSLLLGSIRNYAEVYLRQLQFGHNLFKISYDFIQASQIKAAHSLWIIRNSIPNFKRKILSEDFLSG